MNSLYYEIKSMYERKDTIKINVEFLSNNYLLEFFFIRLSFQVFFFFFNWQK